MTLDRPNSVAIWRSARFSAFGSTSVGRGWWAGRPGSAIGSPAGVEPVAGAARMHDVTHAWVPFLVVRAVCEAIQIAKPTSEPMPTIQANRPSLTGPSEPIVEPP